MKRTSQGSSPLRLIFSSSLALFLLWAVAGSALAQSRSTSEGAGTPTATSPSASSDSSEDAQGPPAQIAGELELEKSVAERLEEILDPLVGRAVVMVDLKLTAPPVELQGFTYSKEQSLPGLPVSMSENVRKLGGGGWDYKEIDGIQIRVFVAESMTDDQIDRITELIPMWISLNFARGDQILVTRVPFVHPPLNITDFLFSWRGVLVTSLGVLLVAVFITLLFRYLFRPSRTSSRRKLDLETEGGITGPLSPASIAQVFNHMGEARAGEGSDRNEAETAVAPTRLTLPEGALSVRLVRDGEGGQRALGSLARLQDVNVTDLKLLLKEVDATTSAIALNLARASSAASYLADLESPARQEILAAWKRLETLSSTEVQQRANELRQRMDSLRTSAFTQSGPDPIVDLINQSTENAGRAVYEDLKHVDKELAEEVRKKVFFLEDVLSAEPRTLRRAVLAMPRDMIAALIKDAPDEIRDRLFENLSQRAANLVREEAALQTHVPPEKAAVAKRMLAEALQRT